MILQLENFTNTLLTYGATDKERAKNLNIPVRTFKDYKAGRLPRGLQRLMRPDLLQALAKDVEQHRVTTVEQSV